MTNVLQLTTLEQTAETAKVELYLNGNLSGARELFAFDCKWLFVFHGNKIHLSLRRHDSSVQLPLKIDYQISGQRTASGVAAFYECDTTDPFDDEPLLSDGKWLLYKNNGRYCYTTCVVELKAHGISGAERLTIADDIAALKLELKTFKADHERRKKNMAKFNESVESMRSELENFHRIIGFKSLQKDFAKLSDRDSSVDSEDYAQSCSADQAPNDLSSTASTVTVDELDGIESISGGSTLDGTDFDDTPGWARKLSDQIAAIAAVLPGHYPNGQKE